MKLILISLALAILPYVSADCIINGQTIAAGSYLDVVPFRQSCFGIPGGWEYYPTACISDANVILSAGQNATNAGNTAVFECQQSGNKNMSYNPIACITPKGNVVPAGQTYNELGSGQYTCQRLDAKTIILNLNAKGCVMDGKFLLQNIYYVDAGNTTQYQCNLVNNKYVMIAKYCYKDGGRVNSDNWDFINGVPYTCDSKADSTGATTASLNLITNTVCANSTYGTNKKLGDSWNISNSNYQCIYDYKNKISIIKLQTCYDESGYALKAGSTVQLKNGSFAYCDSIKGYYIVDSKWNLCKLPDNQTIKINQQANCTTDGNIYSCTYDGTKSWTPARNCWVSGTTIYVGGNTYGVPAAPATPTSAYKCTSVKASFNSLYKLNQTEFDAWLKSQGGSSGITGTSGGGSGGSVAPSSSTTTTTTTTTTTSTTPTTTTTTQSTTPSTTTQSTTPSTTTQSTTAPTTTQSTTPSTTTQSTTPPTTTEFTIPSTTTRRIPPAPTVCLDSNKDLCQKVGQICTARASFVDHTDDEWCENHDVYNAACRSYMRASADVLAALCPVSCNICSKVPDITDAVDYMVKAFRTASQE